MNYRFCAAQEGPDPLVVWELGGDARKNAQFPKIMVYGMVIVTQYGEALIIDMCWQHLMSTECSRSLLLLCYTRTVEVTTI